MDGKKHQELNAEIVKAVRNRAAKYPGNDWAKQIVLICDYAHERIHETSEGERLITQKVMRGTRCRDSATIC